MRRYYAQFRHLVSYDLISEWKTHAIFSIKEAAFDFIAENAKQRRRSSGLS